LAAAVAATVATLTPFPFTSGSCDATTTASSKINDVQNPYKQQQCSRSQCYSRDVVVVVVAT